MDTAGFEDDLDRFGGDLARWPANERAVAAHLLATSAEARDLLAKMTAIEACLTAASPSGPFTDMAAVAMRARQVRPVPRAMRRMAWGAATAAALMLGLALGNLQVESHDDSPDQVMAQALGVPGTTDVD